MHSDTVTDKTFNDLGVSKPYLVSALEYFNFEYSSPPQKESIPRALKGQNLVVQAKNGTGKTLAFVCIMLELLEEASSVPQVLVVTATREIANQVFDFVNEMTFESSSVVYSVLCCGGYSRKDTINNLKQGAHILIGTVGRLKDMIQNNYAKLDQVKLLVLDEADKVASSLSWLFPKVRNAQTLCFSATYSEDSLQFLRKHVSFEMLKCHGDDLKLHHLKEYHLECGSTMQSKVAQVLYILHTVNFQQAIVFYNKKGTGNELASKLRAEGFPCLFISGDMPQAQRLHVIQSLRFLGIKVMLSTDLTSRGIDVLNVNLVVNYEVPPSKEVYLHRVGRAGRYGTPGMAVTLVENQEAASSLSQFSVTEEFKNFTPEPLEETFVYPVNLDELQALKVENIEDFFGFECELCKLNTYGNHCHCQTCLENYQVMVKYLVS
mmetsp:Transcript_11612/g.17041  ORF Transcript_11612/g.17041 Transcript_11612/m.17041 type:complete len:435 (-) Transcript_11612:322-1626(-)